jgi:hypothetical protein
VAAFLRQRNMGTAETDGKKTEAGAKKE